jgi:hypothetical protein
MDQCVTATFKRYYLRKTFAQLVKDTDCADQLSVKKFWRNFNIKKAIDNTGDAWAEVTQSCMNGVWRKIWPDVVTDFHGFEPEEEISNSRRAVVDMVRSLGFEVDEANVNELLQFRTEELSNENLLELEKELNAEDDESSDVVPVKHPTTKQLVEFLSTLTLPLASQVTMMPTEREVPMLPGELRVLWFVTKNSIERGRKPHVSSPSITSSRELKNANPLTRSLQFLQGIQPGLTLFHTHQHHPSHLIKLHMFIHCKTNNINKK